MHKKTKLLSVFEETQKNQSIRFQNLNSIHIDNDS